MSPLGCVMQLRARWTIPTYLTLHTAPTNDHDQVLSSLKSSKLNRWGMLEPPHLS